MPEKNRIELGSLWDIVLVLADGEFHSGEELGLLLNISRTAVWKHLQKLEYFGVNLSSVKGKGYCIPGGLDLLCSKKITSLLKSKQQLELNIFPQIDSTNSFLMEQLDPARQVCCAEFQSAGRGRRGRLWVSPMAQNLYFSIGWGFEGGVAAIEGLSLVVGVAISRALNKCGLKDVKLKWPNDVLYQNKKLAGVLIEMTGDPSGYCQVVIGVGLNVSMQELHATGIDQPWAALNSMLAEDGLPHMSRNQVTAMLLDELLNILQAYESEGLSFYLDEWMNIAAYKGQQVELRNGQALINGTFAGVTESGALRLLCDGREQIFHGGEVSLRSLA
ncbi:MAG TPA: bifunctional biotin--[acetyl-CoA-carboxylase] ligase/biotin operon repressor BirA [Cellvibrio sp.]|nr:bifunctional biotin--[acetyl-CoA-carboxylase] ligase/biotin operon repressor BirA [Cellvibrio sp.]